jgi:hypothetical protein
MGLGSGIRDPEKMYSGSRIRVQSQKGSGSRIRNTGNLSAGLAAKGGGKAGHCRGHLPLRPQAAQVPQANRAVRADQQLIGTAASCVDASDVFLGFHLVQESLFYSACAIVEKADSLTASHHGDVWPVSKISTFVKKIEPGAYRNNLKRKAYRISFAKCLEIKYDLAEIKLGNMKKFSFLGTGA